MKKMAVLFVLILAVLVCTGLAIARETSDGSFIGYDNGTVLDTSTNLMWAAKDNGSNINWANAKSYCENYRGGGYSDWRMPTQDELKGLYGFKWTDKNNLHMETILIELTGRYPWASGTDGSMADICDFRAGLWGKMRQSYNDGARALPVRGQANRPFGH